MKIAFISNPNSTHTRRWVDWFRLNAHQVLVIADTALSEAWQGPEIHNLPAGFNIPVVKYLVWGWQTRRIIGAWRPDILHAHRVTAAGWIASLSGFSPLVLTPWGSDLYQYPQRSNLGAWLTRWVFRHAAMVTTDSQDLRRMALHYGASPDRTHLVQWGVDREIFHPAPLPAKIKEQWGLAGKIILYSPRNMHPLYNLDTILLSAQAIIEKFPEVVFILRDLNADAAYRQQLFAMVQEKSLGEHVRIIGRMPWEQTIPLYEMADLVISVPSSDGTPVSVLEAMACGAPMIASDLPSLREWIRHRENGMLVPVRNVPALETAVLEALSDPELLQEFSVKNLELVAARADHQVEMQKMEALYHSLLSEQRSGRS